MQPSGIDARPRRADGADPPDRADNSVSVLRITGKKVELVDTVAMGEQVAHVVFTPDGRRALAAKFPGHKIAVLDVAGEKVTYNKYDHDGRRRGRTTSTSRPTARSRSTADNGNSGAADGQVDTVSVIDLAAAPPRASDKVVVGDGRRSGLAISPTGKFAVAMLLRGSNAAKSAFFYNKNGSVVGMRIEGKTVTKTNEVEVGGLPEGAVFSDDGRDLYVGNLIGQDVTILRVDGDRLVDTGKRFTLPGHPASMRGRTR